MNSHLFRAQRGHQLREVITLLLFSSLMLQSMQAAAPGWWSTQGAINSQKQADDYAVLNQGQLKSLASRAWLQMELSLPGGAGATITQMVAGWRIMTPKTDDYAVVSVGQLKKVARPFYERLANLGCLALPPWLGQAAAGNADDYAVSNLGQAKNIFSFVLPQAISGGAPQRLSGNGMSGTNGVVLPSGYTWGSSPPVPANDNQLQIPGILPATTQDVEDYAYQATDYSKVVPPEPLVCETKAAYGSVGKSLKFKIDENNNPIPDGVQWGGSAFSIPSGESKDSLDGLGSLESALEELSEIGDEPSNIFDLAYIHSHYTAIGEEEGYWDGSQIQYRIFGGGATTARPRDAWFKVERRISTFSEIVSRSVEITPYSIRATRDEAEIVSVSSTHWDADGETEEVFVTVIYPEIIQVNDGDADGDETPDFADGISTTYPAIADTPELPETAALTNFGYQNGIYNSQAKFRFIYNASDPASVTVTTAPDGTKQYQPAAGGGLRLWRQKLFNSVQVNRNPRSVNAGGDFVAPNEWYSASDLGSMYCESVALSQQLYDQTVTIEVDPGDGQEVYTVAKHFFTSIGMALEKVQGGVIGERDMRMRPSLPNPVINLQNVTVANPHTSEDGGSLLVDISFSGTVNSAVCDLTPGADTGTIQTAYASVNDEPLLHSVVSVDVTKGDTPAGQDRPYPYQGSFTHELKDVVVTEGQNTLGLMVSDPMYHLSGTAEVNFEMVAAPPAALGDGTGSMVTLELPVAGSALAADEARLSISVDDESLVDDLVLKKQAGGLLYRSADGQASFQFTQPPVLSATAPDALHGYVTLPQDGWQGAAFSPLTESGNNTGAFVWSAEETYGGYWGWSVTVGEIGDVKASSAGEFNAYTARLQGPSMLLDQVRQIHIGGQAMPVVVQNGEFRVADSLHPERPLILASLPIDAVPPVEVPEDQNISQELAALGVGTTWEELDVPEEQHDAMEEAMSRRLAQVGTGADFTARIQRQLATAVKDRLSPGFYGGFLVGFVDNPWSSCKDGCNTLLGLGKAATKVAWMINPLGVVWEFTFGDRYQGEIKAARQMCKKAYDAASGAYQFAKEWGGPVCEFLGKVMDQSATEVAMVLRGEIPQQDKMGPELQMAMEVVTTLLIMADDAWVGVSPYERGYWQGYIAFEVAAVAVAAVLTLPAGGAGGAAVAARHGAKVARILSYLEKLLSKFEDIPAISKVLAKLRSFTDVAKEFGDFCFVAGTPVLTSHGPRPIESIDEGDWVWSRDDQMGEWGWRPVARTFVTHPDTLVEVSYQAEEGAADEHARAGLGLVRQAVPAAGTASSITCTAGHLVHARRKLGGALAAFIAAGSLQAGDLLTLADGRDATVNQVRVEQSAPGHSFTTYNFTVAGHHTYFAGDAPVWVHNKGLSDCESVLKEMVRQVLKIVGAGGDKTKYFQILLDMRRSVDPRVLDAARKVKKLIKDKVWARAAWKVSEIMLAYVANSNMSDEAAYDSTPTVEQWNEDLLGRPQRDANGKWIITDFDDLKTMIKGGSVAKTHHVTPERLIRYMNDNGYSIDIDKVPGVILTREEHDLIEKDLKAVIPHKKSEIVGEPSDLLDKLEAVYDGQSNPKFKNMAKVVRGFKIKHLK